MELMKNIPDKKIEYKHFILFNGKKYIREEIVMPQSFSWKDTPDKIEDFHTIKWREFNDKNYEENIEEWRKAGGIAIHHVGARSTIAKIERLGYYK